MMVLYSRRGAFISQECCVWLRQRINACATEGIHQPTLSVANNAPAHAELDDLVAEYDDVPLFCLAPYSQLLNPLELVWSSFKSRIKRNPRERMEELAAWSC